MRFLLLILSFSFLTHFASADPNATQLPSPEQITKLSQELSESLEEFKKDMTEDNFNELSSVAKDFNGYIQIVSHAIEKSEGGAITPKVIASLETIRDLGIDINEALFAYRTLDSDKIKNSGFEQPLEDLMINQIQFPMLRMAFKLMRDGVDERSNVDGRVTTLDILRRSLREIGRDFSILFSGGKNRVTGEAYYALTERIRREKQTQALIPVYQRLAQKIIPASNAEFDGDLLYNRESHAERASGLLLWLTDRAVNIRAERNAAQKYAVAAYFITGVVASHLGINFLGDSYTAHLESAIIIFSAFTTRAFLKRIASSVKSTSQWIDFSNQVRANISQNLIKSSEIFLKKSAPAEYYPANVPHWIKRRIRLRKWIGSFFGKEQVDPSDFLKGSLITSPGNLTCKGIL